MSSGDEILKLPSFGHFKLLDTISAIDNGVWIDVSHYQAGSIHFVTSGTVTLTVQIRGSSLADKPANTAHGAQIGSDQVFSSATETLLSIEHCPRWLKARVSARTNGTVSVYAILRPLR